MKYIKVAITKNRTEKQTSFTYPEKYDANKFNIIQYENKGKNKEYAIAITDDSFVENDGLIELTKKEAELLIEDFVNNDKDIHEPKLNGKTKETIILSKKSML